MTAITIDRKRRRRARWEKYVVLMIGLGSLFQFLQFFSVYAKCNGGLVYPRIHRITVISLIYSCGRFNCCHYCHYSHIQFDMGMLSSAAKLLAVVASPIESTKRGSLD